MLAEPADCTFNDQNIVRTLFNSRRAAQQHRGGKARFSDHPLFAPLGLAPPSIICRCLFGLLLGLEGKDSQDHEQNRGNNRHNFPGIGQSASSLAILPSIIGFFNIRFSDLDGLPALPAGSANVWLKPQDYKIAGAVLAEVRKASGVTQQDLAKRLKKPQSFVSSYEAGQRRIDVLELLRIAGALGADPKETFSKIVEHMESKRRPTARR